MAPEWLKAVHNRSSTYTLGVVKKYMDGKDVSRHFVTGLSLSFLLAHKVVFIHEHDQRICCSQCAVHSTVPIAVVHNIEAA